MKTCAKLPVARKTEPLQNSGRLTPNGFLRLTNLAEKGDFEGKIGVFGVKKGQKQGLLFTDW